MRRAPPGDFHSPIAAGKNTVADRLARHPTRRGRTVVVADVDDVAAMVARRARPRPFAARVRLALALMRTPQLVSELAHGALVQLDRVRVP